MSKITQEAATIRARRCIDIFGEAEGRMVYAGWTKAMDLDLDFSYQAFLLAKDATAFAAKPPAMDGQTFRDQKLPRTEWIVNKVIPKGGLVAISGVPGSYKSFFALWLGLRAAEGLPLFELGLADEPFYCELKTDRTGVLFIEEENTVIMTHERLLGLKTPATNNIYFRVDQGFKVQDPLWTAKLLEDVKKFNIGLIIMDPFSSVMGFEDENDNAEVSLGMDNLRKNFLVHGVTIIFIHHPSKSSEGGTNLRGAGDILGKCDVHIHLAKDEIDKKLVTVTFPKMRLISDDEVSAFKMRATGDSLLGDMSFRYLGQAKPKHEEARDALAKQIFDAMIPGELTLKSQVADLVGSNHRNDKFQAAWKSLEASGQIRTSFEKKRGNPLYLKNG